MNIEIPNLKTLVLDASQLDPKEAAIIAGIVQAQLDLLTQHWTQIQAIRDADDSSEVSISLSSAVNSSGPRTQVVTKISYSQKYKDEREDFIDDPNQTKMNI